MTVYKFGEWLPDLPVLDNPGMTVVTNAVPENVYYRPFRERVVYSGAMAERCQGAISVQDSDGNTAIVAGTASKLYTLTTGTTWTDKSGATYATATAERWEFVKWSNTVIATNYVDVPQVYTLGAGGNFAALSGSPPRGKHICVSGSFVLLGNVVDSDGTIPNRVWWSGFGSSILWTASVSTQCGYRTIEGPGGAIQKIVSGVAGIDALVFQRKAIWRATYVGSPVVWQFDMIEGSRGLMAPSSVVQLNGIVYFLTDEGFFALSGLTLVPIGTNKVNTTFLADLDANYLDRITCGVDPSGSVVYWAYPSTSATAGNPDKIIAYNPQVDRWGSITLSGTGVELIFDGLTVGVSLDDIDAIGGVYANLDTVPFSLDSFVFMGGARRLAYIDADHKMGYFTGDAMAAVLETGEFQPFPNQRCYVTEVWPLVDAGTPRVAIGVRSRQQDTVSWVAATDMNAIGFCPQRAEGRYVRARVSLSVSASWSKAFGLDVRARSGGWR